MKIGILAYRFNYYTVERIIAHKLPEVQYVPVWDLFSLRRKAVVKINQFMGKPLIPWFDLNNQFDDFDFNKVDLLHFSNGISYGNTPWVSSFETILPRFSELLTRQQGHSLAQTKLSDLAKHGLDALASISCKQIFAWSECSAKIERDLLREFPSAYQEAILPKMTVLHPPQDVLISSKPFPEETSGRKISFMMAGKAFFRKGGREVLKAFDYLIQKEQLPIRLILVSSLAVENYAAHETSEDVEWAKKFILDHSDWIEYYPSLPNREVLELLKKADVGLLPTWADSYGFFVLEAQACGCPMITTNIRALPEINHQKCGWLISVPRNEWGEALYNTEEERAQLSETIQKGLENIVRSIVADPGIIAIKSQAALQRVREEHDPLAYAEKLRVIYQLALQ